MIAWCSEQQIAGTIYEPLASGVLTDTPFEQVRDRWVGSPWEESSMFKRLFSPGKAEGTRHVVDGLRGIAQEAGATVAQVAIAWVLRQPGVAAAIAGSGNPDRALSNARAADVSLSDAQLKAVDDLIPFGPAFA